MNDSLYDLTKEELIIKLNEQKKEIDKLNKKLSFTSKEFKSFKELFNSSPTPMWEEDITLLIEHFNELKKSGVKDFYKYFENKKHLLESIKKIKILNINKATINLHGAESQKQLIKNWPKLFTEKSNIAFKKELAEIAKGNYNFKLATNAKTFDNKLIDLSLHLNITKRKTSEGLRYFALISTLDITDQRAAENKLVANQKALRSILDASHDVALLVDPKGFILESNRACQDLFRVSRTSLIGRKLNYFADEKVLEQRLAVFNEAVKERKIITFKNEAYGKFWFSTVSPILNNEDEVEKVAIFHRDVTKSHMDEKRIRDSEIKYRTIFNNIQTSITHVNDEGYITEINDFHINNIGKGQVSKEEYIGTNILNRKSIIEAGVLNYYKNLLKGKSFSLKNIYFPYTTGGSSEYFNLIGTPLFDGSQFVGGIISVENVTQRILSENQIKESEEKFRVLTELAPIAITIINNESGTEYLYANSAWEELTGFSRKELKNLKPIDFVQPEMREIVLNRAKNRLAGKSEPSRYEMQIITKSKEPKWVDFTSTVIKYNNSPALLTTILDISERKRSEEMLRSTNEKLRNLSTYLNNVREEERKNIAREIHDNLGQKLTALNLDISWIKEQLPDNGNDLKEKFNPILELVEESIVTIQKLSTELRPGILDDLGLNNAIQWQTNEISRRTGLKFNLNLMSDEIDLSEGIKIALFRVYQEALTNVVRHANAKLVFVKLNQHNGSLVFEINDDGIGIASENIDDLKSFGIIGMKERITAINGSIEFTKRKQKGTNIKIKIPLEEKDR